jgi:hypothetical protein
MSALTIEQKAQLFKAGFIPYEVAEFDNAKTPSGEYQTGLFDTPGFQQIVRNRLNWVTRKKAQGTKPETIIEHLSAYYRQSRTSSFDLLKATDVSPSARQRPESDKRIAERLAKQAKIKNTLSRDYSFAPVPRNIPAPPKEDN